MDLNRWSFWLDRTDRLMKEQQYEGKKLRGTGRKEHKKHVQLTEKENQQCLIEPDENSSVRKLQRLQFSLINYTVLIERKARA